MRPKTLEEFEGQEQLLGVGKPLFPLVQGRGKLPSSILWGPPGSGKTTLARLLAARAKLRFVVLSAVAAGVRQTREAVFEADRLRRQGIRTALFIDELHRFNKTQQDALLPYVERGVIVLLGATTENPSFEVTPPLRSRCRIFRLTPLKPEQIDNIVRRALADEERGLGRRRLGLEVDAGTLLVRLAEGDARRALTLLDMAAERSADRIDRGAVEAAMGARVPDHDKSGDAHYDVVSAFIKSLRGSDPDAAVYWLARMLEAGEDPRFITRRMLIFASEDVGNADPLALAVAAAAADGFDRVGLPEGRLILSQAATYLACAPKSNAATQAIGAATTAVQEQGTLPVPLHLRNAPTELLRREGHGVGYRYPHEFPEHFVLEQYLPDALREARFYRPTEQGREAELGELLRKRWGKAKSDPKRSGQPAGRTASLILKSPTPLLTSSIDWSLTSVPVEGPNWVQKLTPPADRVTPIHP
jgi:putative ATPase